MRSTILSVLCTAVLATALSACSIIVKEEETPCGNGVIEGLEECDTEKFDGETCASLGYPGGGHLICTSYCRIDDYNCNDYWVGDNVCDDDESPEWSSDCPQRQVRCGDDLCDPSESIPDNGMYCETDCAGITCGDGWCDRPAEYDGNCGDCSSPAFCGDGICQPWEQEAGNCRDCGVSVCGNGSCEGDEPQTCPGDCVTSCNQNTVCEPAAGENYENCLDCYDLMDCGNGLCDGEFENSQNCPSDCDPSMCALMNGVCNPEAGENAANCSECAGMPDCGNYDCGPDENVETCPFDCSTNCIGDGKCQPESGEYAPHCPDCEEFPHCGNNMCDEGEDANTCGYDCASTGYCGDGSVNSATERCDGGDMGGQECEGQTGLRGQVFEYGDLMCNGDCTLNTWECFPKDIGASCDSSDECGTGPDSICLTTPVGNFCSVTCTDPGSMCPQDGGTTCEDLSVIPTLGIAGAYCLRNCMSAMPGQCPPDFACDNVMNTFTRDYCHPQFGM